HRVALANIGSAYAEARTPGIEKVEVHQLLERLAQRPRVIEAERTLRSPGLQPGRRHAWLEEAAHARCNACQRAPLVEDAARHIAFEQWFHRYAIGDQFPELAQPLGAPLRRVAGDQRAVDGADRYARNPVGVIAALGQRRVDTCLIGAKRTSTLQNEAHLRAVRRERFFACFHTLPAQRRRHRGPLRRAVSSTRSTL